MQNPYEVTPEVLAAFTAFLEANPVPERPKMVYVEPTPPEGFVRAVDDDGHVEYKCGCCGHPWDGD